MKRNELKSGVILTYVNLFASNVISILYTPYILNTLGRAEYGVYTLVWSIVNYLTVLDLGFSNSIIRYASKYRAEGDKEKESRLYGTFFCIYIFIAIVALVACKVIGVHFGSFAKGLTDSEVSVAAKLVTIGSINIAISFPFSVFRGVVNVAERFTFIKIVDLLRTLLTPVTTFMVLYSGHSAVGLMWAYTGISLVVMLMYIYYTFGVLRQRIVLKLCEKSVLKDLAVYSVYTFLGTIVDKIYWGTDQVILANKKDSGTIAIYSIGSNFPNYFISFSTAISGVLLPRITKLAAVKDENTPKLLSDWFVKVGRLQFWVLSLVLLGFAFFGKQFIILWAGAEYEQSFWIAMTIMIPSLISLSQNTGISILQAQNKIKFRSISYLLIALFNIAISLLLVKRYGAIGCAIGTAMGTVLGPILLMNVYYQKVIHIDIPAYWKNVVSMLKAWIVPVGVGVLICRYSQIQSYLSLLLWVAVFSTVFFINAYFLGFNAYEKHLVNAVIQKLDDIIRRRGEST